MARFSKARRARIRPLNECETVIRTFNSAILGGGIDGDSSLLTRSEEEGVRVVRKPLRCYFLLQVNLVCMQHWNGIVCSFAGLEAVVFDGAMRFLYDHQFHGSVVRFEIFPFLSARRAFYHGCLSPIVVSII